jgi:uncharacterized protein YfbU (UPF0304 family)
MSALESIISQRIREFCEAKPDVKELEERLSELSEDGASNVEASNLKAEITRLREPSAEEIEYLLQVGRLLQQIQQEEDNPDSLLSGSKDFFGCSVTVEKHKGLAYRRYMAEVEGSTEHQEKLGHELNMQQRRDLCDYCGESDVMLMRDCAVCRKCATVYNDMLLDCSDAKNNITYEQQINDIVPIYSYNRLNHLNEWLSKLQAREMTSIPTEVIDSIRVELKKARITSHAEITQKKVKELLKKLKMSKFYEHVPNITNLLTGAEVPKFPPLLEDKIRIMFEQIQEPFRLFCPRSRKNFLHYGYVLYKFCELLGEDKYLRFIPMLKSFEKLYAQDQIFKKICGHLKWEFIPSV